MNSIPTLVFHFNVNYMTINYRPSILYDFQPALLSVIHGAPRTVFALRPLTRVCNVGRHIQSEDTDNATAEDLQRVPAP